MLVGSHIGPFEIEQEIGSGAMGTVYRAKFHKDAERVIPVALKVVALGLLGNEGAMARFTRESAILKQLRHPHIVKLIATGRHRQTPFIAMEYIDGEPLDRALARRGRLSWEEVAAHAKQLCLALQHAHEHGIIHRDLKPSNLMITRDGTLKLTDFGIAKDTDVTALTGANSTIGTAAYMSPEQCRGERNLTPKSDLYSLGVVLFELLTGRKPFAADNTVEMFLKHVNEKPPRPGKLVPDLPTKFEALILQLMEKDKDDRPTDGAWVGRMLGEIEEDAVALKSAGLDAANARRVDRPRGPDAPTIEQADRDAARALRGDKTKRRKKKRPAVPWFERKSVRGTGILVLLLGIGTGLFFAFKPPSQARLFAAVESVEKRVEANEGVPAEVKVEAAERYLKAYGSVEDEKTDRAARLFRSGKVQEREKQLATRLRNNVVKPDDGDDPRAYEEAWHAMQAERDGYLKDAADWWGRVKARFPEEAKLPYTFDDEKLARARWGWVADKRIHDIQQVARALDRLRADVQKNRDYETPMPYDPTSPPSVAARGLRLEQFGDHEKAARTWDVLISTTEKESDLRVWYLLGCQQKKDAQDAQKKDASTESALESRRKRIGNWVDQTRKMADEVKGDPSKLPERWAVRTRAREVVELYGDEDDKGIAAWVARAKQLIADVPKT